MNDTQSTEAQPTVHEAQPTVHEAQETEVTELGTGSLAGFHTIDGTVFDRVDPPVFNLDGPSAFVQFAEDTAAKAKIEASMEAAKFMDPNAVPPYVPAGIPTGSPPPIFAGDTVEKVRADLMSFAGDVARAFLDVGRDMGELMREVNSLNERLKRFAPLD